MKKEYFDRLLMISVPIMLSNIISQLQMLIDRIFLGHVDNLYMSALGNASTTMWTTMSFVFSLSVGASILISQGIGAGDKTESREYAASLLKWHNIIPIVLCLFWAFGARLAFTAMGVSDNVMKLCLAYAKWYSPVFLVMGIGSGIMVILQTSNYTKPMLYYGIIRSGLNIVLDYIMIFGKLGCPALGIEGAAIATTISEFAGGAYLLVAFISKDLVSKPTIRQIKDAKIMPYIKSAKLGLNTALEDFAWSLGNLVIIRILNSINELAAGIYSIVFGVEVVIVVVVGAIGNGTMTITGEATGAKDKNRYVGVIKIAYLLSAAVSLVLLIASIMIPEQIIGLFTSDRSVITSSAVYLLVVAINMFPKSGNIIIGNGIRGKGDTRWMLTTQIFGTAFVIGCAALFVFVLNFGILGVFLAVLADESVRAVINLLRLIYHSKSF